jgi:hypothetical protein
VSALQAAGLALRQRSLLVRAALWALLALLALLALALGLFGIIAGLSGGGAISPAGLRPARGRSCASTRTPAASTASARSC